MDYSERNIEKTCKDIRSRSSKVKNSTGFNVFRFFIIALLIVIACGIAALVGGYRGVIADAPEITADDVKPSRLKSTMYYSDGSEAVELVGAQSNRTVISIDEMPTDLQHAFIAIEDERFYEHNGIDPKGIMRALFVGLTNGDFSQGASTITQQLIKITIFNGGAEATNAERFKRKFQEWHLALELEKQMSKDEILEAYLNTVNFGCGAYGVEAAAERYFNKHCSELTLSESACLAAIVNSPTYDNPVTGQEANAQRRTEVLDNMLKLGYITQSQYDEAMADDVYARVLDVNSSVSDQETIYTWFEDATISQVIDDLQDKLGYSYKEAVNMVYSGGLQIYLTENKEMQDIVDSYYNDSSNFTTTEYYPYWSITYTDANGQEVNADQYSIQSYYGLDETDMLFSSTDSAQALVDQYKADLGITDDSILAEKFNPTVQVKSSFVLMDQHTGEVLAISGGRGEKTANRSFNRATDSTRQPGSVFKILTTYLPGIDSCGMSLASTKVDAPYTSPDGYNPHNATGTYRGTTTVREAITNSINVVTVKFMVEDVTPEVAIDYLDNLGFTTIDKEHDAYAPLALGGIYNGVTNLELTAAYAAIANGGTYIEPIMYSKILDSDGNVLIDNVPEEHRAMRESTAWLLTSAMEDVVSKGTGTPAQISETGIAEAGKTGTTENSHDLWFVGYTPYFTAGIWLGYDNSISMEGRIAYSQIEHKILWSNIMSDILAGYDDADFTMPDSVEKATVCKNTGLLPGYGCPTITEYFAKDDIPTKKCTEYGGSSSSGYSVQICSHCGLLATSLTPDSYIVTKYYSDYSDIPQSYCQDVDESKLTNSTSGSSTDTDSSSSGTDTGTGTGTDTGGSEDTGGENTGESPNQDGEDTGDDVTAY